MSETAATTSIYLMEDDRIKSFKSWPYDDKCLCNITKMAEAGFFWCGNEKEADTAACFTCGKVLDGWEELDDPWAEHKKHAPQCLFVKYGKPEKDLTCEELFNVLETILKGRTQKRYNSLRGELAKKIDDIRNTIIAEFDKN